MRPSSCSTSAVQLSTFHPVAAVVIRELLEGIDGGRVDVAADDAVAAPFAGVHRHHFFEAVPQRVRREVRALMITDRSRPGDGSASVACSERIHRNIIISGKGRKDARCRTNMAITEISSYVNENYTLATRTCPGSVRHGIVNPAEPLAAARLRPPPSNPATRQLCRLYGACRQLGGLRSA